MTRPQHTTIDSELAYLARALKAPRIGSDYATIAEKARQASWTYEEYLAAVLSVEASARAESGAAGRIKRAGFPQIKTIDEFDFSTQPALDRARIARLETGGWITEAANVIFLGPPGTGKTHLATGLGVIAARQGYRVAFDTAAGWITRLTQAHSTGGLTTLLTKLNRYHLLIIDEVGYVPIEAEAANLFFQLVSNRYERGSLIMTSNLPFSRWGECFGDVTVAAAMIDRIVHHAEIFTHTGTSYRIAGRETVLPSITAERQAE
ncbi:MAG TPA: IS21-like element helper ATPase IstB [Enteractinococcus sp.]